jgi:hypothetical protein
MPFSLILLCFQIQRSKELFENEVSEIGTHSPQWYPLTV